MQTFIQMLDFYAQHHRKTFTKIAHFIGIPLIILGIQIFLALFSFIHVSFAWIALIAVFIYYLFLDKILALITGASLFILTAIAIWISNHHTTLTSLILAIILFALGWGIQLIGHAVERKPPVFLKDGMQIFIGPLFLVTEICFLLGHRQDLKNKLATFNNKSES